MSTRSYKDDTISCFGLYSIKIIHVSIIRLLLDCVGISQSVNAFILKAEILTNFKTFTIDKIFGLISLKLKRIYLKHLFMNICIVLRWKSQLNIRYSHLICEKKVFLINLKPYHLTSHSGVTYKSIK